jgi:hypothetical protein
VAPDKLHGSFVVIAKVSIEALTRAMTNGIRRGSVIIICTEAPLSVRIERILVRVHKALSPMEPDKTRIAMGERADEMRTSAINIPVLTIVVILIIVPRHSTKDFAMYKVDGLTPASSMVDKASVAISLFHIFSEAVSMVMVVSSHHV